MKSADASPKQLDEIELLTETWLASLMQESRLKELEDEGIVPHRDLHNYSAIVSSTREIQSGYLWVKLTNQ